MAEEQQVEPTAPAAEAPAVETPTEETTGFDAESATLADWRKHEQALAKGESEDPPDPPAEAKAEAEPEPEPEPEPEAEPDDDDIDEIKAEADKVEPPKPDETPQERSARTRRNRRKAQKAYATRVTRERDEARAELERLRGATATARPATAASAAGLAPAAAPQPTRAWKPRGADYDGSHPDDPQPKLEDFNGDENEFFRQSVRHEVRREQRIGQWRADQQRQQAQSVERQQAARAEMDRRVDVVTRANAAYRDTAPDFDAVTKDVVYGPDVIFGVADLEDPAAVLYHLAQQPDELAEVRRTYEQNPRAGLVRLTRIESRLEAARQSRPKPSSAPAPAERTVTGRSATTSLPAKDPADMDLAEWRRYEASQREASVGV